MYELVPVADDGQEASVIGAAAQVKIRRVKLPVRIGLSELSRALLRPHARKQPLSGKRTRLRRAATPSQALNSLAVLFLRRQFPPRIIY